MPEFCGYTRPVSGKTAGSLGSSFRNFRTVRPSPVVRPTSMELKLAEFKALYKAWKRGIPWVDHLLLGLLYWLEEKLIDNRVKVEVDEAIKEFETLHSESLPDLVSPVYTESPSDTSTSLPEMRLTAPWYIDSQKELKGR